MTTTDAAIAPSTPDTDAPLGDGQTRPVKATCLGCIAGELDRLEAAHAAGTLRAHGGWTAGQVLWHVGEFMTYSLDGFPFRPPLPIRVVGRLMKGMMLGPRPMPKGIRLNRPGLDALIPPADVSFAEGLAHLREPVRRVQEGGEQFTIPSPLIGPLTHAEWVKLHAKHFAHHASFLSYPEG